MTSSRTNRLKFVRSGPREGFDVAMVEAPTEVFFEFRQFELRRDASGKEIQTLIRKLRMPVWAVCELLGEVTQFAQVAVVLKQTGRALR